MQGIKNNIEKNGLKKEKFMKMMEKRKHRSPKELVSPRGTKPFSPKNKMSDRFFDILKLKMRKEKFKKGNYKNKFVIR